MVLNFFILKIYLLNLWYSFFNYSLYVKLIKFGKCLVLR